MNFTAKEDYGIRAVLDLAAHAGAGPVQTREIAQRQHIPEQFLEQLLAALRRAEGWGPTAVGMEPRNAVETVVATASGTNMPFWVSKCTHPSPNDGCRPRTRATSYAMPATLERSQTTQAETIGISAQPRVSAT